MLHGVVHAGGVPTIVLPVAGKDWLATIDTGFNGDLELPEELRDALHARYVGRATAILAGDQSVTEDVFVVDFPFDRRLINSTGDFCFWVANPDRDSSVERVRLAYRLYCKNG